MNEIKLTDLQLATLSYIYHKQEIIISDGKPASDVLQQLKGMSFLEVVDASYGNYKLESWKLTGIGKEFLKSFPDLGIGAATELGWWP